MESTVLRVRGLTTGYRDPGRPPVVPARELEAELGGGELVCLLGPNGAGKSTLLNTLSGALRTIVGPRAAGRGRRPLLAAFRARATDRGGVDGSDRDRTSDELSSRLSGPPPLYRLARAPFAAGSRVAEWALQATGALDLRERFLGELSDGERQRVLVARAFAQEPEVLSPQSCSRIQFSATCTRFDAGSVSPSISRMRSPEGNAS